MRENFSVEKRSCPLVSKVMRFQRCHHLKFWTLWIHYITEQRGIQIADRIVGGDKQNGFPRTFERIKWISGGLSVERQAGKSLLQRCEVRRIWTVASRRETWEKESWWPLKEMKTNCHWELWRRMLPDWCLDFSQWDPFQTLDLRDHET